MGKKRRTYPQPPITSIGPKMGNCGLCGPFSNPAFSVPRNAVCTSGVFWLCCSPTTVPSLLSSSCVSSLASSCVSAILSKVKTTKYQEQKIDRMNGRSSYTNEKRTSVFSPHDLARRMSESLSPSHPTLIPCHTFSSSSALPQYNPSHRIPHQSDPPIPYPK